jgi:isoquinoline 1-oxidoreductase beta subunit
MLYAAVKGCPALGGKLKTFDAPKVSGMPGVRHVVAAGDDAVAVVATTWWQAKQALDALPIVWDETLAEAFSTDAIIRTMREGLDAPDSMLGRRVGDPDAGLASASKTLTAEYQVPYLAHATMEPQTCTAWITADRAEVWAPTQNGEGTMGVVAALLQRPPSKITIHKCHLGGGFGRRGLSQDWARQAVLIARTVGQPVKMLWTREQDTTHDFYRPLVVSRQAAGLDAQGRVVGWKSRVCGASIFALLAPHFLRDGKDTSQMNGFLAHDMSYDAPFEVTGVTRSFGLPVGFWRAVNYSQNGFFREAFVDEMAHAAGKDAVQFRRQMLGKAPRTLRVLNETAERAGWGHAPKGIHQGIAVVEFDDAICGQVVELSVDKDGAIKIHRVVCVIEGVHIVHPDSVVAQMEGCIVQALGATLTGEITATKGRVDQSNFHDCPLLRLHDTPLIETTILPPFDPDSTRWGGIGEAGVAPLAPALVNALFSATGQRIRSLPLKNHTLKPKA